MPDVAIAEDLFISLNEQLMHVEIHRDQILREYQRHEALASNIKGYLKSVHNSVLAEYKVNLYDYVAQPIPVFQFYS